MQRRHAQAQQTWSAPPVHPLSLPTPLPLLHRTTDSLRLPLPILHPIPGLPRLPAHHQPMPAAQLADRLPDLHVVGLDPWAASVSRWQRGLAGSITTAGECRLAGKESGAPNGIRIRAAGLKGRCPRPLDDGGTRVAGGLYLGVRGAPTGLPRGRLRSTADSEGQMTHPTVVGPFAGDGTELPAMYEVRQRFDLLPAVDALAELDASWAGGAGRLAELAPGSSVAAAD